MPLTLDGDDGISGIDGSAATPAIQGADSNTGITFGTDIVNVVTGGSTRTTVDGNGRLLVGTTTAVGSSNAVVIKGTSGTSNGSLYLGNASAASTLVAGNTLGFIEYGAADGGTGAQILGVADGTWSSTSDCPTRLVFSTTADSASSPTERMRIGSTGAIIAAGIYSHNISGTTRDVYVKDDGLLGYISSTEASKGNINVLSDVDWLYQLQPKTFNYRIQDEDGAFTDDLYSELEYGLIAEEVQSVAPDLCFYDETDNGQELRGVSYRKLITPLLAALQQANQRIEQLETRVAQLEGGAS